MPSSCCWALTGEPRLPLGICMDFGYSLLLNDQLFPSLPTVQGQKALLNLRLSPAQLLHGQVGGLSWIPSNSPLVLLRRTTGCRVKPTCSSLCRQEEEVSSSGNESLHLGDALATDTSAQKSLPTYRKSLQLSSELCLFPLCCRGG